jgi:hypothetical protein
VVKNFVDNKKKEKLNDEVLKFYCVIWNINIDG